jgi:hypothetical protein
LYLFSHFFKVYWTSDDVNFLDINTPGCRAELPHWNLQLYFADGTAMCPNWQSKVAQGILLEWKILEFDFA